MNTKRLISSKGFLYINIFIVSALLALINIYFKLEATPAWFDGRLDHNHVALLNFSHTNNEQSRLFQFYIPELFIRLFDLSIPNAYLIQRLLFTTTTFFLFFLFAKKWFNNAMALICIVIMACIMPFTYYNHLQESAPLMSLTFLCAIWSIRENNNIWYMICLFLGSINNETMLFVPIIYFLYNFHGFEKREFIKLCVTTILMALPAFAVVVAIRLYNIDRPHAGDLWNFYTNIPMFGEVIKIFNVIWFLAYMGFKNKPLFLQRCLLSIPFFILPHMLTGIISETRQMIPLSFILIPSALFYLKKIKNTMFVGMKPVVADTKLN